MGMEAKLSRGENWLSFMDKSPSLSNWEKVLQYNFLYDREFTAQGGKFIRVGGDGIGKMTVTHYSNRLIALSTNKKVNNWSI